MQITLNNSIPVTRTEIIVLQSDEIRCFLEEATALDPRFKQKMTDNATVWDRIKERLLGGKLIDTEQVKCHSCTNTVSPQSLQCFI